MSEETNPVEEKEEVKQEEKLTKEQLDAQERENVLRKGIPPKNPKEFARKLQTRQEQPEQQENQDEPLVNENEGDEKKEGDEAHNPVPPLKTE